MKYYLSVVQNPNTESELRYLNDYTSEDEALAIFHQELAVRGATRTGTICKVFSEDGIDIVEETYIKNDNPADELFYVFIAQNQGEAGESDAVYKRDNYDAALALFHQELGYRHEVRNSTIVSILTAVGNSVRDGSYFKSVE